MTYNTDFAQIEVDTQQINLTRFNLRFPEKRPFFLKNSGLFTGDKSDELDLFFSRRIGLDDSGAVVPITAGARLSGKVKEFDVGALNMQTDDAGTSPSNNFSLLRTSRELRGRSSIGAIVINRAGTGRRAGPDDWNRTWGADAKLGLGERVTVTSFAARTETPGLTGREYAYNVDSEYDDGKYQVNVEDGLTGENFTPEVGCLEKEDGYCRYYLQLQQNLRQPKVRSWGFLEFLAHANYTRYEYRDGSLQSAELYADNHFDGRTGTSLQAR